MTPDQPLSLSLSVLLLCAALSACSEKELPGAAAAPAVSAAAAAAAAPQDENVLMQAVFGKDYQADSGDALADLPDPDNRQVRSRYLVSAVAHTVLPNGVTVLVANAENANAEGKADSGHASPGLLNVFFLKRDGARWQVLGRHENIGAYGSFGQLGDVS